MVMDSILNLNGIFYKIITFNSATTFTDFKFYVKEERSESEHRWCGIDHTTYVVLSGMCQHYMSTSAEWCIKTALYAHKCQVFYKNVSASTIRPLCPM